MTPLPTRSETGEHSSLDDSALSLLLPRRQKVVLVMDLVESVRLMAANEAAVVQRWHGFVQHARGEVLPRHQGRHVKSLGDGLLAEFDSAVAAVQAAHELHHYFDDSNVPLPPEQRFYLRAGVNAAQIYVDSLDIYGTGVNLASRVAGLAAPGETVVTAEVRDRLTEGLDASLEDLGSCFVKHVSEPVRVWRAEPVGPSTTPRSPRTSIVDLRPTIAVVPFAASDDQALPNALGDALADQIIAALSRTSELDVISRLSTSAFRGRHGSIQDVRQHLGANYILSGSCQLQDDTVVVFVELVDAASEHVIWAEQSRSKLQHIFLPQDELIARIVGEVSAAVIRIEMERGRTQALPTLAGYSLLLGAVALMHRYTFSDFQRAKLMLDHLTERMPRNPLAQAWTAQWHVLNVQQGWSADRVSEARLALQCTQLALDSNPECAQALSAEGFVYTNLLRDSDKGLERYESALAVNPNDSFAWLLRGTLHAFRDEGPQAVADTQHALRLSPLDPLRYFYDSLAASSALAACDYALARNHALRSLRANRSHTSTLRALVVAQVYLDELDAARTTLHELLKQDPQFSVSEFLARSPSNISALGQRCAEAFRLAGLRE